MALTVDCDETRWPLAFVTFSGSLQEHDFDEYLAFLDRCHQRREIWGLLLDASAVRNVSARQRRKMADFLREHADLAQQYCAGTAFVIDSPLARGTLTAIFWFQKQPTPYVVVGRREQAIDWLYAQIGEYKAGRRTLPPPRHVTG